MCVTRRWRSDIRVTARARACVCAHARACPNFVQALLSITLCGPSLALHLYDSTPAPYFLRHPYSTIPYTYRLNHVIPMRHPCATPMRHPNPSRHSLLSPYHVNILYSVNNATTPTAHRATMPMHATPVITTTIRGPKTYPTTSL